MPVTKGEVIKKFKSLHATYYVTRGAMIFTVPDVISEDFIRRNAYIWHERYCSYASTNVNIRTVTVNVPVFGKCFEVGLDRPLVPEHRREFEDYFGFGGHCDGYTENRIVLRFLQEVDVLQGSIQSIMLPEGSSEDDPVDIEYAKNALRLLILGGYVKYWAAASEFETWFIDVAGLREIIEAKNSLAVYVFEHMQPK